MVLQATEACGRASGKKAKARDRRACSLTGWLAAIGNLICPCTLRRHFLQCAPAADADVEMRFNNEYCTTIVTTPSSLKICTARLARLSAFQGHPFRVSATSCWRHNVLLNKFHSSPRSRSCLDPPAGVDPQTLPWGERESISTSPPGGLKITCKLDSIARWVRAWQLQAAL